MKIFTRSAVVIVLLLLLCTATASAASVTLHQCTVSIERATPDRLVLELWSTSQSTNYSVGINYSHVPCRPWTADGARNWIERKEMKPGLCSLSWAEFYDENPEPPEPGMEACINYTCQPETVVIYWSQDYQTILGYLYLPLVRR